MTYDLLEQLQADVLAVLQNTPTLTAANILADDAGDIEARVVRSLGALKSASGTVGLAVVVLLPEVTRAEANLPGPPLRIEVEIQTLENVSLNRGAQGSGIRSSQAALRVLSALHHCGLGARLLYADGDPVTPVPVKNGHVSHAVKLLCRENGIPATARAAQVSAEMAATAATASGNFGSGAPFAGNTETLAGITYTWADAPAAAYEVRTELDAATARDNLRAAINGAAGAGTLYGAGTVAHPDLSAAANGGLGITLTATLAGSAGNDLTATTTRESGWSAFTGGGETLTLTTATSGAAIYYTTDGSYPAPSQTLYTAPIAGLDAGAVVRTAAYLAGLNPGDVTELLITA